MSKRQMGLCAAALIAVGWAFTLGASSLTDSVSDVVPDWLFAKASWSGVDPYQDYPELAVDLGMTFPDYGAPSKTPANVFVASPLLTVSVLWAERVMFAVNLVALYFIVILTGRISGRQVEWWWWFVFLASMPVQGSLWWGNPIFVYLTLILWTWDLAKNSWWVGVPLGVAASVRLWPVLLVLPLWYGGRRKAALGAAGAAVGLNLAGLALPSITLSNAANGLLHAGNTWVNDGLNSSLIRLFGGSLPAAVIVITAGVGFVWWLSRRYGEDAFGASAIAAVMVSPLAWVTYYLVAAPTISRLWALSVVPALLIGWPFHWVAVIGAGLALIVLEVRRLTSLRRGRDRRSSSEPRRSYTSLHRATPGGP